MPARTLLLVSCPTPNHFFAFPATVPFKRPSILSATIPPGCHHLFSCVDSHWSNLCFLVWRTSSIKSQPISWASSQVAYCCKAFFMMSNHSRTPACPFHLSPVHIMEQKQRTQGACNCFWWWCGPRLLLIVHSALAQESDWQGECFKSTPLLFFFLITIAIFEGMGNCGVISGSQRTTVGIGSLLPLCRSQGSNSCQGLKASTFACWAILRPLKPVYTWLSTSTKHLL